MSLPNINEYVARIRKESAEAAESKVKKVESGYLAVQLLAGEGIFLDVYEWTVYDRTFDVDVKDLPAIRRALGRLTKFGTNAVQGSRERKIWVVLQPCDQMFSHLKFRYKAKLPKGAKCKIVSSKQVYRSRQLICEA